jgi:hypothetical protein
MRATIDFLHEKKAVQLDLEAKGLVMRKKEGKLTRWYCS